MSFNEFIVRKFDEYPIQNDTFHYHISENSEKFNQKQLLRK